MPASLILVVGLVGSEPLSKQNISADPSLVDTAQGAVRGVVTAHARRWLGIPFAEAPVGGRFRVDGELASFFTAKDESFMIRRTLSRLVEMTS